MDDKEMTPKHITKDAMVPRSLMKWWALSELKFSVQHHPRWQGLAELLLTVSYIHTGPAANTKSITRKGRLTALLSPCIVNSTRIASTHACTVPSSWDSAPDKREAGLGPSPHHTARHQAGKEPRSLPPWSWPSHHPLLTKQGTRAELHTRILVPTSHSFHRVLGT